MRIDDRLSRRPSRDVRSRSKGDETRRLQEFLGSSEGRRTTVDRRRKKLKGSGTFEMTNRDRGA